MSVESTREDLLSIEQAYQEYHDGGYALASALCTYRARMTADRATEWDEVLLAWVGDDRARFWGVALEALARAGGASVSDRLAAMLREPGRSEDWREYVANTLIRRGFCNTQLKAEVEEAALRMSPMGLPNLAALLVVVPEMLASAAACIVAAISAGKYEYDDAIVPPFVYAAADSDPELLIHLVEQTLAKDHETGRRFGSMIAEHLAKPFVQRRFEHGVATEIAMRIQALAVH